jgi:two-component system LytT family response regulator
MYSDPGLINVLIVDDEMEACVNLHTILEEYVDKEINIVGIANNTKEAEKRILELAPDAIFLDIEMPNENAFHFWPEYLRLISRWYLLLPTMNMP